MTVPVIELQNVVREYPSGEGVVRALRGLTLSLMPGEFATLVGPSGCGKSTLLNVVGCLDRPTSGTLLIDGEDTSGMDSDQLAQIRNRKIGFIFQHYNLLPRMSARRNVEVPMIYARIPPAERTTRALELLGQVGLGERAEHTPAQLSGGECQRVAIARALALDPSLLLADEPTGNLDTRTGAEITELFLKLHNQGNTILMVTHSPEMAALGERKLSMRDGVLQDGA